VIVIFLEKVPKSVRGELTRWLLELRPGVFVGNVSALVRERLWEMICQKLKGGAATLLHSAATEQGFSIRANGKTDRTIRDFEGISLVQIH